MGMPDINTGDTAWLLISAALVLLMTPGLAFFYGGMVRTKSVLNMMMMSFISIGVVSILWVLFGYSVAFGDTGNGLWGGLGQMGLGELIGKVAANGGYYPIPALVFAMFQLMFAIITVALISGAIADRTKFLAWGVFAAIWVSLVYFPVAHWVFDFGGTELLQQGPGWLAKLGVLDFAGGTAVHINAGAAGLALALVLGRRVGWPKTPMKPHSLPLVLLGSGLLYFGWFGFNAGSALGANQTAALAFTNTMLATAAGIMGWSLLEKFRDGHATSLGVASGAVAGLVAVTPACAFIVPWAAVLLGLAVGAVCAMAVSLKFRFGFDDSLDVVGVHLVGGIFGSLFLGFFATTASGYSTVNGLFYGGGLKLLGIQATGVFSVLTYSFLITLGLGLALRKLLGMRISKDDEVAGIDLVEHAESAYEMGSSGGGGAFAGIGAGALRRKEEVNA
jgi:Amt family ammonium transporter